MANQSLINAAQRMYSAKAAKAQKDIAPILQGFELGTGKIMEALTEKKKEQEEKAAKTTESFKDIILKSGTARPQLTNELKALQDEYYKNIRISEGVFRKGKTKQEAIDRNNEIAGTLKLWEEDLRSRDLATARPANISDFEGIDGMANELSFRDDTLADDLIFKPDGVYTKNIKNEEVRLSKHEQPVGIFDEGVDILNALQKASVQEGKKGNDWDSYVLPELSTNLDRLMRSKNWGSLLFDDIGSFNWATEQMKQEFPDADLSKPEVYEAKRQELRDMVKADPTKYKKEFEEDVVRAYKMNYDDALAKRKEETSKPEKERDTTFLAGQYVPNVDLLNNFTAILDLKSKPGRTNATIIAGIPSLGRVWYDDKTKMYVYEDIDSSGLSTSVGGYKKSMTADIKQLLSSKTGGVSNKFFVQSKSNDPFNPK